MLLAILVLLNNWQKHTNYNHSKYEIPEVSMNSLRQIQIIPKWIKKLVSKWWKFHFLKLVKSFFLRFCIFLHQLKIEYKNIYILCKYKIWILMNWRNHFLQIQTLCFPRTFMFSLHIVVNNLIFVACDQVFQIWVVFAAFEQEIIGGKRIH